MKAIVVISYSMLFLVASYRVAADCKPEILFTENFDNTPDWVSQDESNVPVGWSAVYARKRWTPSTGHSDRHYGQEILAMNTDKARGNKGKSWVSWRESFNPGWLAWNSDDMLSKTFPQQYKDLHISFYIKFNKDWHGADSISKLFRVFYWNGDKNKMWSGFEGALGPMMLWDYNENSYGLRNLIALRGGPAGSNYQFKSSDIIGLPREVSGIGDISLNFTSDTTGIMNDGTNPILTSKTSGKEIPKKDYIVKHGDIFGDGWTKIEFYLKLNSAPDIKDGILMQWVDDSLVFNNKGIPWVRKSTGPTTDGWNGFAIGGNDFFNTVPNADRFEEWYAIDDISVSTGIPSWFIEMKSSTTHTR